MDDYISYAITSLDFRGRGYQFFLTVDQMLVNP